MVMRTTLLENIDVALKRSAVVVLTGPRQSGKTTLARQFLKPTSENYFDLEDPASQARLSEPMTALASLRGLVVIDEIQRLPQLYPVLRVLADRRPLPARFLILGSASGELLRQTSESLAGRLEQLAIGGFTLAELASAGQAGRTDHTLSEPQLDKLTARLWLRGGFPPAYLARTQDDSFQWRKQMIQTLLERDLPQWGVRVAATALRRFWAMLAHYHGQIWNAAEPARALGVSEPTVRRYLDLLCDAFMLRQLPPWHANLGKRQVKAPKVYVRDSGLLHCLLGLETPKQLHEHPKLGASWEGFVIEQLLRTQPHDEAYFWATHQGAEIDLLLRRGDVLHGYEIKRADAPRLTPSIRMALSDLELASVTVIYPGSQRYTLAERVVAVPLEQIICQPTGRRRTKNSP